jgi:hypothetical protein
MNVFPSRAQFTVVSGISLCLCWGLSRSAFLFSSYSVSRCWPRKQNQRLIVAKTVIRKAADLKVTARFCISHSPLEPYYPELKIHTLMCSFTSTLCTHLCGHSLPSHFSLSIMNDNDMFYQWNVHAESACNHLISISFMWICILIVLSHVQCCLEERCCFELYTVLFGRTVLFWVIYSVVWKNGVVLSYIQCCLEERCCFELCTVSEFYSSCC